MTDRDQAQETVNQLAELVGQEGVFWQGKRMEDAVTALLVLASDQPDAADAVFEAWARSFVANGMIRPRRTRKRLDQIKARLNEGHPVEDLVDAAQGWQYSEFHRGDNDERKVWNDIGLLMRDANKVEYFRDLTRASRQLAGGTDRCIMCGEPLEGLTGCPDAGKGCPHYD